MSKSAATRSNRQRCWDNRDSYYACLTKHNIHSPPGTDMTGIKGPLGAGSFAEPRRSEAERAQLAAMERSNDPCLRERDAYEGSCAQSWVSAYSNIRSNTLTSVGYSRSAKTNTLPMQRRARCADKMPRMDVYRYYRAGHSGDRAKRRSCHRRAHRGAPCEGL